MQKPQEMQVQTLGGEDPLEEQMATHSSNLAWRIPWSEETGGLHSMGSQRVRHNWVTVHAHKCQLESKDSMLGQQETTEMK